VTETALEQTEFCQHRRLVLSPGVGVRDRVGHMVRTEVELVSVLSGALSCSCGLGGHPADMAQRLANLCTAAAATLAVSLWWLRSSTAAELSGFDGPGQPQHGGSESDGEGPHWAVAEGGGVLGALVLGTLMVSVPLHWGAETLWSWLHRPVLDVVELQLRGVQERDSWRGLCCMRRDDRIVPYWVAERYLQGKSLSRAEGQQLPAVHARYFTQRGAAAAAKTRTRTGWGDAVATADGTHAGAAAAAAADDDDDDVIPRLLGARAAEMRRHEPWLWHLGAAWMCWAQLAACAQRERSTLASDEAPSSGGDDDSSRRRYEATLRARAGVHGACFHMLAHMVRYGRGLHCAAAAGGGGEAVGEAWLRARGGAALLLELGGRDAGRSSAGRLWRTYVLGGEVLAQLEGWGLRHATLRRVHARAKKAARANSRLFNWQLKQAPPPTLLPPLRRQQPAASTHTAVTSAARGESAGAQSSALVPAGGAGRGRDHDERKEAPAAAAVQLEVDPCKALQALASQLTVAVLALPRGKPPTPQEPTLAEQGQGQGCVGAVEQLLLAVARIAAGSGSRYAGWAGPDDPRFVGALHHATTQLCE
jgi:hypothetical protein